MNIKKFQDKRMNIMVNKIGLSEKVAEWCLNKSKKYSIWIANQLLKQDLVKLIEINKDIILSNDVNSILEWKKEVQNINLNEYKYRTALKEAKAFSKSLFVPNNNSLNNTNVVLDCGDYKWVQLITEKDCQEEGRVMGHCIGGSSHKQRISSGSSIAFSLRDKYNKPHLTLEANSNTKNIFEFKGSSNSIPKTEYLNYFALLNDKYKFSEISDGTKCAFESNVKAVEEIIKVNSNFFSFDFQLKLGLLPFKEGESYVGEINIITSSGVLEIPSNIKFYASMSIESDKINLGDNLLIGGDLKISSKNTNKLNFGKNIGVGGNLIVTKNIIESSKIENINYFGELKEIEIN